MLIKVTCRAVLAHDRVCISPRSTKRSTAIVGKQSAVAFENDAGRLELQDVLRRAPYFAIIGRLYRNGAADDLIAQPLSFGARRD